MFMGLGLGFAMQLLLHHAAKLLIRHAFSKTTPPHGAVNERSFVSHCPIHLDRRSA